MEPHSNPLVRYPVGERLFGHEIGPQLQQQFLVHFVSLVVLDLPCSFQCLHRVLVALVLAESLAQVELVLLVSYVLYVAELLEALLAEFLVQWVFLNEFPQHLRVRKAVLYY